MANPQQMNATFEDEDPYRDGAKDGDRRAARGCLSCLNNVPSVQPNPIAKVQAILYAIAAALALIVCIPIGVQLRRYEGGCLLFAQLNYRPHHDSFFIWPWMDTGCDYVLYMTLAVDFMYCIFMFGLYLLLLAPKASARKYDNTLRELFSRSVDGFIGSLNSMMTVINVIIWIMHVVSACLILTGFHVFFCMFFYEGMQKRDPNYDMSCIQIDSKAPWEKIIMLLGEGRPVNGSSTFASYTIAMIAAWLLVFVWSGQLYLNFGQICTRCTCRRAEEKVKIDQKKISAAVRSRMMSPIGTPGGYSNVGGPRGFSTSSAFNTSFA